MPRRAANIGLIGLENRRLQGQLVRLAGERPTHDDRSRLAALDREQLNAYGFVSVPPDEVEIAPDNYLRFRAGEPISPKDLSASDNVRLIWAYLVGLLEISREFHTPHPGLVVCDAPGQQEVSDDSLRALFEQLGSTGQYDQQAVVAISKEHDELTSLLGAVPAFRNDYDGHVLQQRGS